MANPNIYAQYAQPVRSIADYANDYARGDALRANTAGQVQQNTINAMTMDQNRAAQAAAAAKQNAIMQLATEAGGDPDKIIQGLYQRGFVGEAQALEKGRADALKDRATAAQTTATTGAAQFKLSQEQRSAALQEALALNSPAEAAASLRRAVSEGKVSMQQAEVMARSIPQDPAGFMQWQLKTARSLASPEAQLQAETSRANNEATVGATIRGQDVGAATQRRGQDISASTTIRGQNLTDSRAREANTSTVTKPFEVTGPDGVPILVRQDKAGNISRVEGFGPKAGAAKPLNDTQAKALLFGSRMQEADKVLTSLESAGVMRPGAIKQTAETAAGFVPFIGDKVADAVGSATNWTQSPDQQKVEQAQRDFVNAVLRRESGAVISDSEFRNAAKQYFPSAGDSPEVRKQKAANRALATRGLMAEVPTGQRGAIASQPANTGGVTVDWSELK